MKLLSYYCLKLALNERRTASLKHLLRISNTFRLKHENYDKSIHISAAHHKKPNTGSRPKNDRLLKYLPKIKDKMRGQEVKVWDKITMKQLSEILGRDLDFMFSLMAHFKDVPYDSPDSQIDNPHILNEFIKKAGFNAVFIVAPDKVKKHEDIELSLKRPPPDPKSMVKRPPVVAIMGHVDHGKTTLLDSLRNSSIVDQEFGGITQHIGAFSVKVTSGETVTFLDTPGHAAFSAMRARGASVTDIVVLVVAADDGVMEQTLESIRYADEADVPIVVAINKIDKPKADIEACKKALLQHGIQLEDGGGDVQTVSISASKGENLDVLIDVILTQAEMMELKGDPKGLVEGAVVESQVDPVRGKLCTAIIQRGTLRKGSVLVGGQAWAKVRAMFNEHGNLIQSAPPSTPVEILGWKDLPNAGDEIFEVGSEKIARAVVAEREYKKAQAKMDTDEQLIKEKMMQHDRTYKEERIKRLKKGHFRPGYVQRTKENADLDTGPRLLIILKGGDVDGSVDAILDALDTYHSSLCELDVIHYGVGAVTLSDVELADACGAVVFSFNTNTLSDAKETAKKKRVQIKDFNVIYRLIDAIKEEINSRLPTTLREEILGEAEVLQEFVVTEGKKKYPVAGSKCIKGVLKKSGKFRLKRGNDVLFDGSLSSMKHLKTEVNSIKKNIECGLRLSDSDIRFQQGDTLICYEMVEADQKIDWDPGF
uniref:Translation initiation factor IF-2, mitochondrial n=1 Tax=Strigamia maritima TaxID=126957 RepID=T1JA40_STRMM